MTRTASQFEGELRQLVDACFDGPGVEYPLVHVLRGTLPLAELRAWYTGDRHWERRYLAFNQSLLPLLLDRCPDAAGRAVLWRLIDAEYGGGRYTAAHPVLIRRFYLALGVPEEELPTALDRSDAVIRRDLRGLERLDFLELLVGHFLAAEMVGPKVFGVYADALRRVYGFREADVAFFRVHGRQDVEDTNVLLELVSRYACTPRARATARRALRRYFAGPRAQAYCALRPIRFRWAAA